MLKRSIKDFISPAHLQRLEIDTHGVRVDSLDFGENPAIQSHAEQYPSRIDAQTQHYVDEYTRCYDTLWKSDQEANLAQKRHIYNEICRLSRTKIPKEIIIQDDFLPTSFPLPIRRYTPTHLRSLTRTQAEILFFHGGGFVYGNLDTHDDICMQLALRTGHRVTAVDYRLAPEYPFPTPFDDCWQAYRHLREHSTLPIIVCGDSAGGTMAAGISGLCTEQDIVAPDGQILIYPYLGGDPQTGSYQHHRDAPLFTTADMLTYTRYYHGEYMPLHDVRATPILADPSRLPPTLCLVFAIDPLADDGIHYCDALKQAGIWQRLYIAEGLVHGTFRAFQRLDRVTQAWDWLIQQYPHLLEQQKKKI